MAFSRLRLLRRHCAGIGDVGLLPPWARPRHGGFCLSDCHRAAFPLMGSFYVSAVLSIIAVVALNYFFASPIFNFRVEEPQDAMLVIAFLLTSLIVTGLVRKARSQTEEALNAEDGILSCRPLNAISTTARSQSDSTICSCCRGAVSGTQQRAQFMATRTTRRRCRWDESSDKPTTFPRTTHEGRCNTRRSNSELANASSFQRQVVGVSIPRSRANSVSRGPSAGSSLVLIR